MIRIDEVWLAVQPMDMRAGADRLLAAVVSVFGSAHAHHGYLFANARANRIKLLVHDRRPKQSCHNCEAKVVTPPLMTMTESART
jgi:transposase